MQIIQQEFWQSAFLQLTPVTASPSFPFPSFFMSVPTIWYIISIDRDWHLKDYNSRKSYATSFFLHPYQLSAPVKIYPWAIWAKRRKCAGTGEGKCVNTICFHKNRIWRKRESGEGGKKDKSERLFCRQLQSDILGVWIPTSLCSVAQLSWYMTLNLVDI